MDQDRQAADREQQADGPAEHTPPEEFKHPPEPDSVARYYEQYYGQAFYGDVQRPQTNWAVIITIIIVVAIGGIGALAYAGWLWLQSTGAIPQTPAAQVHVGTALTWREIDSWSTGGFGSIPIYTHGNSLLTGDFDQNGVPDILALRFQQSYSQQSQDFQAYDPASGQPVRLITLPFGTNILTSWDYTGDGVVELATDGYTYVGILDLAGNSLATLNGQVTGFSLATGDVDGDGTAELICPDPNNTSILNAYGTNGQLVWSSSSSQNYSMLYSTGDIDGDGLDEVIKLDWSSLTAEGMNQAAVPLTGWPSNTVVNQFDSSLICADLNGDGNDDVIFAEYGWLDCTTGIPTHFQWPSSANQQGGYGQVTVTRNIVGSRAVDFDADGTLDIAIGCRAGSGPGYGNATALVVFDPAGSCIYYEEFGEDIYGFTVVRANGQDYFSVQTASRLLVYP